MPEYRGATVRHGLAPLAALALQHGSADVGPHEHDSIVVTTEPADKALAGGKPASGIKCQRFGGRELHPAASLAG